MSELGTIGGVSLKLWNFSTGEITRLELRASFQLTSRPE